MTTKDKDISPAEKSAREKKDKDLIWDGQNWVKRKKEEKEKKKKDVEVKDVDKDNKSDTPIID